MLSCTHGKITGLNAGSNPLTGPADRDAVGRSICARSPKAVLIVGHGWACR
jgi:hypothetical protein